MTVGVSEALSFAKKQNFEQVIVIGVRAATPKLVMSEMSDAWAFQLLKWASEKGCDPTGAPVEVIDATESAVAAVAAE